MEDLYEGLWALVQKDEGRVLGAVVLDKGQLVGVVRQPEALDVADLDDDGTDADARVGAALLKGHSGGGPLALTTTALAKGRPLWNPAGPF